MQPRRVILMYISEISGHHRATVAIEQALRQLAPETQILNLNAFNYTNPISERIVNRLYMSVIKRTPQIWDYLYDNPAVAKRLAHLKKTIHKFNSPKLKNLFDQFRPDIVACSQAFPCGMCADYKAAYGVDLKLVAVLTDYVPHSYWIYNEVDYYISPADEVTGRLAAKGVPVEKIRTYGIPVDPCFTQPVDRSTVARKFGLEPTLPTLLVMGGGQGLGPIQAIIDSLELVSQPIQEIVVTGSNTKLYRRLNKRVCRSRNKISLFGYTDAIPELMGIADLIITKPGGITTAEALARRLPMIIINPIPGQESNNTIFLTSKGAALKLDEPGQMHLVIEEILAQPRKLQELRDAVTLISKPQASLDIARLLLTASHG